MVVLSRLFLLMLIAGNALAGTRDTLDQYAATLPANDPIRVSWQKGETLPMRDHLAEPVSYSTTVTLTTNTVSKSAESWALEQQLGLLWVAVGGSLTNTFEANLEILKAAILAADQVDATTARQLRDAALQIVALYAKLKSEGCPFDGLAPGTITSVSTNSPPSVSQYRWQALGFDHLPNGNEIEASQR